jgi:ComF family protein
VNFIDRLINIIYPPSVFLPEAAGSRCGAHICSACYSKLPLIENKVLRTSLDGDENYCDGVVSVSNIRMVKESLIRFKFYSKPGYYRTYARLLADKIGKVTDVKNYQMVLSVPLHKHKEFSRGYNQARLISKALSRILKMRECSYLLRRERYTEAQSLLDKQKRNQNVKGAFAVVSPKKVKGKTILLVDDILTTGSTLEECSRVLKQAGAEKVFAVVVATGRK